METAALPSDDRIREALRQAGGAGLSKSALSKALKPPGKPSRQTKEAKAAAEDALRLALQRLEGRETVNFGTAKTPRYVLREFDRRLELARETLEQKATPGKATVFNLAALRKGAPKGVMKPIVDEAIQRLVNEGRLIVIQPGKSIFYLHARSVEPLIAAGLREEVDREEATFANPPEAASSQPLPRGDVFSPEAVRQAYALLVREAGFADVSIADLQTRSGAPLADLQAWLLAQSRAGQAAPTRGDWSLADLAARRAAIAVRGEPHLLVRLL